MVFLPVDSGHGDDPGVSQPHGGLRGHHRGRGRHLRIPVIALPELFDVRGSLPVAAATLTAAVAFSPVRRVVQQHVDRQFNRARFNARRELETFAARLRSQVDLDTLIEDLNALIDRTLEPSTVSIWFRPPAAPTSQRTTVR